MANTCFEYAELSEDGRLAYYAREFDGAEIRYVLEVVDLETGSLLFRDDLDRPDQGWVPKSRVGGWPDPGVLNRPHGPLVPQGTQAPRKGPGNEPETNTPPTRNTPVTATKLASRTVLS